jgi:hypothetical protein
MTSAASKSDASSTSASFVSNIASIVAVVRAAVVRSASGAACEQLVATSSTATLLMMGYCDVEKW